MLRYINQDTDDLFIKRVGNNIEIKVLTCGHDVAEFTIPLSDILKEVHDRTTTPSSQSG